MRASHITRSIVLLSVLYALSSGGIRAQGRFGFGFIFGEPTGIAWKYKINHLNAIDGAIGFSPFDRFRMHVDYLWQSYPFEEQHLAFHYGLGAAFGFGRATYFYADRGDRYFLRSEELAFGARTVLGLTYTIPRSPLDVFLEMAPIFVLAPDAGVGLDVGAGVRIYP